jgi:hypothetical protein
MLARVEHRTHRERGERQERPPSRRASARRRPESPAQRPALDGAETDPETGERSRPTETRPLRSRTVQPASLRSRSIAPHQSLGVVRLTSSVYSRRRGRRRVTRRPRPASRSPRRARACQESSTRRNPRPGVAGRVR